MRKKRKDIDTANTGRMTDAALSKKLGRCQLVEDISILLGVVLLIGASISAFVLRNVLLLAALCFVGVGLILLVGMPAQKKKNALIQQQLGDFFRMELNRVFGPEPQTPELPIDQAALASIGILSVPWTECHVENFYEGIHNGLHFSAANVALRRIKETGGAARDATTGIETLFSGIVVRCRDICDPALDLIINDAFQERKGGDPSLTDSSYFRRQFTARTADNQPADDQVTPELRELIQKLEAFANNRKMGGLVCYGGTLTLALNTGYVFAGIPSGLDVRNIDAIRKWFTRSLDVMGGLLDLLHESPALTAAGRKAQADL